MPRAPSAHSRLLALQRGVYRSLQRQATALFGPTPPAILRYEGECRKDLRGRPRATSKDRLIGAIRKADVTFLADYHTYGQTQRTALRLLREAVRPGEPWAIGLELVSSEHQDELDAFQAGRLSEPEFLQLVHYRENWGFPWRNYEPIFRFARERGIRLLALNRPKELIYRGLGRGAGSRRGAHDLQARDQWAAGVITDAIHERRQKVFVLYGGLHVGHAHLPAQLERVSRPFLGKTLRSVSIHQNVDGLYWSLARRRAELRSQIVRLPSGAFCVFSGTPWGQLQSLVASAEGAPEAPFFEEDGQTDEESALSLMAGYGKVIAEFTGLPLASFGSVTVKTLARKDFLRGVGHGLSRPEARAARELIETGHRLYLPREQIAYLGSPSPNAMAELAAIHLLRRHSGGTSWIEGGREGFCRLALEAAFGFLGSLVLNPRRKCDLPADHARRIRAMDRGARPEFAGEEKARKLAYGLLRGGERKREKLLSGLPASPARTDLATLIAARYVGQALAKDLYPLLLPEEHASEAFRSRIRLFARKKGFEAALRELLEAEHPSRRPVRSKTDAI